MIPMMLRNCKMSRNFRCFRPNVYDTLNIVSFFYNLVIFDLQIRLKTCTYSKH